MKNFIFYAVKDNVTANDQSILVQHRGCVSLRKDWKRNALFIMEKLWKKKCYRYEKKLETTCCSWCLEGSQNFKERLDYLLNSATPCL